jgi:hypothetical protein
MKHPHEAPTKKHTALHHNEPGTTLSIHTALHRTPHAVPLLHTAPQPLCLLLLPTSCSRPARRCPPPAATASPPSCPLLSQPCPPPWQPAWPEGRGRGQQQQGGEWGACHCMRGLWCAGSCCPGCLDWWWTGGQGGALSGGGQDVRMQAHCVQRATSLKLYHCLCVTSAPLGCTHLLSWQCSHVQHNSWRLLYMRCLQHSSAFPSPTPAALTSCTACRPPPAPPAC